MHTEKNANHYYYADKDVSPEYKAALPKFMEYGDDGEPLPIEERMWKTCGESPPEEEAPKLSEGQRLSWTLGGAEAKKNRKMADFDTSIPPKSSVPNHCAYANPLGCKVPSFCK